MDLITCIKCGATFESETWISGECPHCHAKFHWEEICLEDYSDCWPEVWFD